MELFIAGSGLFILTLTTIFRFFIVGITIKNIFRVMPYKLPTNDPGEILPFSGQWMGIFWIILGIGIAPLLNNIEWIFLRNTCEILLIGFPCFFPIILIKLIRKHGFIIK